MALIKCPECGSEVSETAFTCVKCGKTLRKKKRSLFGKVIKILFIVFNILMLVWMVGGMNASVDVVNSAMTEAERAGASIGTGIGFTFILIVWALGDAVLGIFMLLTRPK